MDATKAIDALRSLTPDELRKRLAELDGEQEALRTILRSAIARQRAIDHSRPSKVEGGK